MKPGKSAHDAGDRDQYLQFVLSLHLILRNVPHRNVEPKWGEADPLTNKAATLLYNPHGNVYFSIRKTKLDLFSV